MLAEVPAAAKMAAAKAAHVTTAESAKVTTAKAAGVAAAEPAKVAASKAVAKVSVRELTAVAVEAVAEAKMATVEAGAKTKAAVIWPVVAVVGIVAGVAPAVGIVAGIRITGRNSANHSGRDGGSGIVAVSVAVSVSPNVMAMACVAVCDVLVRAVRDPRVSDPRVSGMLSVSGMLIMTSHSRRIRGGKRRRQHQSGRAKRESRNSKSAKSHGEFLSGWRRSSAAETPLLLQIDPRYSRTRSQTITISRVLHWLSCRNRKPPRRRLN
jgi:hypothetical protein